MPEETKVTRGSQITLTRDVREKMHIKEGDRLILNIYVGVLVVSKRDAEIFDDFESFLPKGFENTLNKFRGDFRERAKRMGIMQ